MAFYDELIAATEAERNDLLSIPFIRMGAAGELSRQSYLAFLGQAYHHVKHTVPLLMATGGRLPERLEWLREAIGEYIEEEMGHQEWILNDIAACGADKEAVRGETPMAATELMVSYAYDTIYRNNPAGFFGMVLVAAIVGSLIWVLSDWGILRLGSSDLRIWLGLLGLSVVLGIGLSWSIVRRALSGQIDVDDLDE